MVFKWNEEKNQLLISERGVSFEMVVAQIAKGAIVDVYRHPNSEKYPNQFIFVVDLKNYLYCVPFIKQGNNIFLKTIFLSRKATKAYHEKSTK